MVTRLYWFNEREQQLITNAMREVLAAKLALNSMIDGIKAGRDIPTDAVLCEDGKGLGFVNESGQLPDISPPSTPARHAVSDPSK